MIAARHQLLGIDRHRQAGVGKKIDERRQREREGDRDADDEAAEEGDAQQREGRQRSCGHCGIPSADRQHESHAGAERDPGRARWTRQSDGDAKNRHDESSGHYRIDENPSRQAEWRGLSFGLDQEIDGGGEDRRRDGGDDPGREPNEIGTPARREQTARRIDAGMAAAPDDARGAEEHLRHHHRARHLLGPVQGLLQEVAADHRGEDDGDIYGEHDRREIFDQRQHAQEPTPRPAQNGEGRRRQALIIKPHAQSCCPRMSAFSRAPPRSPRRSASCPDGCRRIAHRGAWPSRPASHGAHRPAFR